MNILIAIDASEIAEKTFDWYVKNLHKEGNTVFVCHEAEQPDFPTLMFAGPVAFPADEIHKIVHEHTIRCKRLENQYKEKCEESNLGKFKVIINITPSSDPGQEILKRAKEVDAGVIVMGTRGLGMIRRTILGSVSDYVVHHANIPVVICRV